MDSASRQITLSATLLKREYKTGRQCYQLLFESTRGSFLVLTRNVPAVSALVIGGVYKLVGEAHTLKQKKYILEPTMTLLSMPKPKLRPAAKVVAASGIGLACLVVAAGITFAVAQNGDSSNQIRIQGSTSAGKVLGDSTITLPKSNTVPGTTSNQADIPAASTPSTFEKPGGSTAAPKPTSAPSPVPNPAVSPAPDPAPNPVPPPDPEPVDPEPVTPTPPPAVPPAPSSPDSSSDKTTPGQTNP